jgi:hypothetical protein
MLLGQIRLLDASLRGSVLARNVVQQARTIERPSA